MNAEHSNAITISAGHHKPCHLCGELCDGLAGNPGKWPIMLPVDGAPKWHHTGCVAARLKDQQAEIERLTKANEARLERNRKQAERIGELHAALIEAQNYIRNLPSQPQAAFKQIDAKIQAAIAKHSHENRAPASPSIEDLREALAPFASGYNLFYRNEPDDRLLSLGHWSETEGDPLPKFYGDVALNVGMVRRAYQILHPAVEDET